MTGDVSNISEDDPKSFEDNRRTMIADENPKSKKAGKTYLKINQLVKTPLHEDMALDNGLLSREKSL